MNKYLRWFIGVALLAGFVYLDLTRAGSALDKMIYPLLLCTVFILFRIARGPTPADRAVAIDILGILVINFCILLAVFSGKDYFVDIGLAWALQSFIATLALAKYLEGRGFEE